MLMCCDVAVVVAVVVDVDVDVVSCCCCIASAREDAQWALFYARRRQEDAQAQRHAHAHAHAHAHVDDARADAATDSAPDPAHIIGAMPVHNMPLFTSTCIDLTPSIGTCTCTDTDTDTDTEPETEWDTVPAAGSNMEASVMGTTQAHRHDMFAAPHMDG